MLKHKVVVSRCNQLGALVMTLAERLQNRRIELGLSQDELATKLGVSQQSIGKIESGKTLNPRNLKAIAFALGVSPQWLQFGEPEEYDNAKRTNYQVEEWEDGGFDPSEFVEVPILDIELSAGDGCTAEIIEDAKKYPFRRDELRTHGVTPHDVRIVKIIGSSLFPVLTDGDLVAVDISKRWPIKDGDLYAIRDGVLLRVKLLISQPDGGVLIRSFNREEYKDEILTFQQVRDRIQIIGRVFWSSRRW